MKVAVSITLLLLASSLASSPVSAQAKEAPLAQAVELKSFEFLGCGDGWPVGDNTFATVRRLTASGKVTYLVRHPGGCGLDGRNPRATLSSGELRLDYESYSAGSSACMCECEYWAKFTFGESLLMTNKVKFSDFPTTLLGENWPRDEGASP